MMYSISDGKKRCADMATEEAFVVCIRRRELEAKEFVVMHMVNKNIDALNVNKRSGSAVV